MSSTDQRSPIRRLDLAALVFLGAVWGAVFLFNRIAAPEVGAAWASFVRIGLAALVLLAVAGRETAAVARGRLRRLAVVGATFSAIPFTLISFAAITLPASMGALLNATRPMFTAIVAAAWLRQPLTPRLVAGLAAGGAAVAVVVGWSPLDPGPDVLLAVAAALGAALSYAVAGPFVRRHLPDVRPVHLATSQLTIGALLLLPVALLSGPPGVPSPAGALSLVALARLATAVAWPLYLSVLSRTTATAASTVTFIVPLFGMLWASIGLSEPVGPQLLAGFGLVIVSLVLILRLPLPPIVRGGVRVGRRLVARGAAA